MKVHSQTDTVRFFYQRFQKSFNRVFKEITGYTPSQFVKLPEPDSYNLTYYKRKSSEQEFVENDSVTLVKNQT